MSSPAIARLATPRRVRGRPPTPGLRDAILRAAERVFARRDFHAVQMDEVAAACGVGKGTLYRYFPSKRALYLAVTLGGVEHLRDEIAAAVASSRSATEEIEEIVRRTLGFFWTRRGFFALVHQQEIAPDAGVRGWLAHRAGLAHLVEERIRRAIAAGDLRPVDPRLATEMLFGLMRTANRSRTRSASLEAIVRTVVGVFMCGVATPAAQRRLERTAGRRPA